jgi:ABC-type transport system involved in cytochrome bd biosynthesis fused ATPase/permease subunit
MENPITALTEIVKDPVELTSITFPSAGLVVVFFVYKQHIHPALSDLPDPLSGNIYGGLLFLVLTLVVSLVLKRVSHDLLNWMYDRLYRDRRRKVADTWYKRVQEAALSTNDPLLSKYQEALESLRKGENPIVAQVDLLQTQSKLARSMSLIFLLFAVILAVTSNLVLLVVCAVLSLFMLYTFFKGRWEASELVYKAVSQEKGLHALH